MNCPPSMQLTADHNPRREGGVHTIAPADQGLFSALRWSWVRSCVRPHMMIPPSMVFAIAIRGELSFLQGFPANLTSGGIIDPDHGPAFGTGELRRNGTTLCKTAR